ncbi:Rap1a/Tai family immunity protein [Massilia aquatica]|uniref:Rap1a immunity protein domain-containing protein n=1 Tax=Massilia aquatica TaxID=2609000 RepID=A0ABX0MEL3_9BURK|nr:Rap1a/Tai family immunity protein [Massilia aquatica]NHZ43390.1 hypothetical protein [Massilia aquatica]
MKYVLTLLVAYSFALPCLAQTPKDITRLTGQQLVDLLAVPSGTLNTAQLSPREQHNHRIADAYIDGVLDATTGIGWCPNKRYKPDTIEEKVIWGLRKLSAESLQRAAAPLILEILRPLLPCPEKE